MSVLVKGMSIPTSCRGCPLCHIEFYYCMGTDEHKGVHDYSWDDEKAPFCPCEEVDEDEAEKKENDTYLAEIKEIVSYLNHATGQRYRESSPKTTKLIRARMREGFTVDDFKTVIDKKVGAWINDKQMQKFLRPETLFGTKFEGYLNELETYKFKGNGNKKSSENSFDRIRRMAEEGAFEADESVRSC